MSGDNPFVDDAGKRVLSFISAARNLSRVGELTEEVVEIVESDAWRRYRTAVGTEEWLECELDYFLIACDLRYEDVSRIAAYTREGAALMGLMDPEAPDARRRPLEQAAKAWHSPGQETLVERARRLGWTKGDSPALRVPPVPPSARTRHQYGVSTEELSRQRRAERIASERRAELESLAGAIRAQVNDDDELRYLVQSLQRPASLGRRPTGDHQLDAWRKDAETAAWDARRLAALWKVNPSTVRRRLAALRAAAAG